MHILGKERELGRLLGEETQKFRCFKSKPELLICAPDLLLQECPISVNGNSILRVDQTKNFDDILVTFLSLLSHIQSISKLHQTCLKARCRIQPCLRASTVPTLAQAISSSCLGFCSNHLTNLLLPPLSSYKLFSIQQPERSFHCIKLPNSNPPISSLSPLECNGDFPGNPSVKNLLGNIGDVGSIPGWESRKPGSN